MTAALGLAAIALSEAGADVTLAEGETVFSGVHHVDRGYDDLVGRFGTPMPAAGFGLYLERVHVAQMEEERVVREGER